MFLALAVIGVIVSVRLANSRLGRAWLYVRHDEDAAEAMGIGRVRVKLAAYVVGAIYGSIGGAFFAANLGAISPESFSFRQSVEILMVVILGGIGKIPGVAAVETQIDRLAIRLHEEQTSIEDLHDRIVKLGARIHMYQPEAMDMETAFMKLTEGKTA